MNKNEYVFGANILENLTTGMYQDSKIIYREYIQNACDQIDKAIKSGLIEQNEGVINIWLDLAERNIKIEDNATGIQANKFQATLSDIANSDKKITSSKGFRGIGRLCGLAYCKKLIFKSKASGENIISILCCDAEKMRKLLEDNNILKKYTAADVLSEIYEFSSEQTNDIQAHWFTVELVDINATNEDLLDFDSVKNYLSFTAPVQYQNTFIFRNKIYEHAQEINCPIDEYNIFLNGEQIFKKYVTHFKTSKGDDEIFGLIFKDIYDDQNNLLAWGWYGLSKFKATISRECLMRGLRLRKNNIQIGDETTLQKFFKEDRGQNYFVGEIFAVSHDLIPNSQRNYFNENYSRLVFEQEIRLFFKELQRVYYEGSAINSAFDKIDTFSTKENDFKIKQQRGDYVSDEHFLNDKKSLDKARQDSIKAQVEIERKKIQAENSPCSITGQIIKRIENTRTQTEIISVPVDENEFEINKHKKTYSATDEVTAEKIISKIEAGLQ